MRITEATMHKRLLLLTFLLSVFLTALLPPGTAQAGGEKWAAWMFSPNSGDMLLLTDVMGGNPQKLNLPMIKGFTQYSRIVAISHDWHYMAYAMQQVNVDTQALAIYDRN